MLTHNVIGSDWMLVGDSAVSLEPISSQGIQVALKLGCQGAVVAHTILSDPSSTQLAMRFYSDQCTAISAKHVESALTLYGQVGKSRHQLFWTRRVPHEPNVLPAPASIDTLDASTRLTLSADAVLRDVPCLIGDRICLRKALEHRNLDGPVSHLGNVPVTALLDALTGRPTAGKICQNWIGTGFVERPLPLLYWFLNNGIISS